MAERLTTMVDRMTPAQKAQMAELPAGSYPAGRWPALVQGTALTGLVADCGLRPATLARLDVTAYDADAGIVDLGTRKIVVGLSLRAVLAAWLRVRAVLKPQTPALFVSLAHNIDGVPRISSQGVRWVVRKRIKELGVRN